MTAKPKLSLFSLTVCFVCLFPYDVASVRQRYEGCWRAKRYHCRSQRDPREREAETTQSGGWGRRGWLGKNQGLGLYLKPGKNRDLGFLATNLAFEVQSRFSKQKQKNLLYFYVFSQEDFHLHVS